MSLRKLKDIIFIPGSSYLPIVISRFYNCAKIAGDDSIHIFRCYHAQLHEHAIGLLTI
ncbi:MAG: hypothetical protein JWP81_2070 [Ferruginibacter sp.]|nr:hypothetical protein [Ferruginibacter sp.]